MPGEGRVEGHVEPGERLGGGVPEPRRCVDGVRAEADLGPRVAGTRELVRQPDGRVRVQVDEDGAAVVLEHPLDLARDRGGVRVEAAVQEPRVELAAQHPPVVRPRVYGAHADGVHRLPLVREPLDVDDQAGLRCGQDPDRRPRQLRGLRGDAVRERVRHPVQLALEVVVGELYAGTDVRRDRTRRVRHVDQHGRDCRGMLVAGAHPGSCPSSSASSSSRASGHAASAVVPMTVPVSPTAGSCRLRNDTPASYPSSSTTSLVACSQKPNP